jgi:mRNA interferase MazF
LDQRPHREELQAITRGTVVIVALDPTKGHEQKKTRHCVVVSGDRFNAALATLIVVPISSVKDGGRVYANEVEIQPGHGVTLLSKAQPIQIRTIDRFERVEAIKGKLPKETMDAIDSKIRMVLGMLPGL